MTNLNESTIEHHAIALFQELGYAYAHGPDIGPDSDHPERADYTDALLLERLRTAIIFFLSVRATLDKTSDAESLVEEQEYAIRQLIVRIPAIVGSDSADRGHPRKAYILVTAILCSGGHDGSTFGVP